MSSDSSPTRLEHVLNFANGRSSPDRAEDARYPVYGSNGLIGRAGEKNSEPNTIVIGRVGSYCGSVHFSKDACWVTDNAIRATAKNDHDPEFLYYLLKHLNLNSWRNGSGQPLINQATLNSIEAPIPEPAEQRAISGVIGMLDDRITLLRETNTTLEAIAQALFKSWFVDFDPVRAKMEGRVPEGMDEATAALFPDSFEETELGEVPRGWKQCSVDDVASLKGGKQLEKEHFRVDGLYPVFGGAGVMGRSDSFNAEGFVITVGRVGAYCGQYFWTQGKAWVNNNASLVTAKTAAHSVWLLHWLMSVDMNVIKKGAAQPFVSNGDIAALKMALPPDDLIAQFVEVCAPIFLRLSGLTSQAKTLTDLRDSLLPRLISGQLCLPELLETEVA